MSTSDRLTAIVRERYETGAHGNAFLMMSKTTMDTISRPEPRRDESAVGAMMRLWDIPIILDAALPVGAWRLIDRSTGAEIESEGVPLAREGWARAIEALRDEQRFVEWLRAQPFEARPFTVSSVQHARRAADYLTDRAAALTEEGQ